MLIWLVVWWVFVFGFDFFFCCCLGFFLFVFLVCLFGGFLCIFFVLGFFSLHFQNVGDKCNSWYMVLDLEEREKKKTSKWMTLP